ncbi:CPBP family intramembrane glutamic endopeptidase [Streptococcus sp. sy010]|uniref:CPBP family intramembrane glutamic endopeptidase n=1 Tax=Streptococcus sp. sy010 TaxID=2600148 RepID=UPI0011B5A702|nr:type II CAAX endopeptidase family protein [Streptococcus sp. sy010]TWT16686.1 CPBP family intramembrane metalloprotease [Streptococcus sp. sy010]
MNFMKKLAKQFGLFLLILVLNSTPFILIAAQNELSIPLQWVTGLAYLFVATVIIKFVWKNYSTKESEHVKQLRFGWKDFGIALLFFLATRIIAILGTLLNAYLNGNDITANDAAIMATAQQLKETFPLYFICFHLAIGLFAPILEELAYRGFLSRYFFRDNQIILPLIVSSTLFSLPHLWAFNFIEFIIYFALGAIFYLAYARRRNIKDAMVVHGLNNGLFVIGSVINYILFLLGQ